MNPNDFPITRASFNLTRNCNLACSYCFTNGCTFGDMPKDTAFKGVDFLFNNAKNLNGPERIVEISFWGGEPLIKWGLLKEIVLYAEQISKETSIPVQFGGTTNGTLLTPEKFDFLDKHKVLFMISFDGTKESHDYHRKFKDGRGSHELIVKNIKEVLKKWPFYRVRLSPFAQRIDHFAEDMKFIFDLGVEYIMFSPVYESNFTDEHWEIWENECHKVIDYMAELRSQGKKAEVEHFKSYTGKDNSKWPCGAGRNYIGIDTDGALYPCHRFNKLNDNRPWQEKEVCIGHTEKGITNPNFRNRFIDFAPECGECPRLQDTPCIVGDTKISLLNGVEIPIQELIDKDPFWVYSSTEDGQIVPGLAHSVRKTGVKEVVEITLDNNESFQCTLDHPLMLRDGTYKIAEDCEVGQSLMPLYRGINKKGYEWIVQNNDESFDLTYRLVDRHFNGHNAGSLHIHHNNFNKRDNTPNNLIRLTKEEHEILHVESVRQRNKEGKSGWKSAYKNPEFKKSQSEHLSKTNKDRWADPEYRLKMIALLANNSLKVQELWKDEGFRKIQSAKNSKAGKIGGRNRRGQIPWNKGKKLNHTIVSVTSLGLKEVYDLTVERYHNFAITIGIFIHNCHGGCYAINHDFTGNIEIPYIGLCKYTNMQKKVSEYYKEKLGMEQDKSGRSCICDFANYAGPLVDGVSPPDSNAPPPDKAIFTLEDKKMLRAIIMDIDRRLRKLEEKIK